jgi:hypothetical protein
LLSQNIIGKLRIPLKQIIVPSAFLVNEKEKVFKSFLKAEARCYLLWVEENAL